jgi:hypothetical protein
MYLARSRDGVMFGKPEKLGTGSWQLNGCPMDGGGLVVSQNQIVTAWRRESEIFVARPGEPEVSLGKGIDVSLAAGSGGVYAVWLKPDGMVAYMDGKNATHDLNSKGSFPNVVALPDGGALAAWETDGRIEIQRIP